MSQCPTLSTTPTAEIEASGRPSLFSESLKICRRWFSCSCHAGAPPGLYRAGICFRPHPYLFFSSRYHPFQHRDPLALYAGRLCSECDGRPCLSNVPLGPKRSTETLPRRMLFPATERKMRIWFGIASACIFPSNHSLLFGTPLQD